MSVFPHFFSRPALALALALALATTSPLAGSRLVRNSKRSAKASAFEGAKRRKRQKLSAKSR